MNRRDRQRLRHDPAHWYWQGRAALDAQEWAGAADAFSRALKLAPSDGALRRARGLALARLDRFEDAIADFEAAARLAPAMARAHADLGVTLLKIKRAEQAIPPLEHALRLDPALEQARQCLGLAYAHAGKPDRALDILDHLVADERDPDIHAARAWAMLNQGRIDETLAVLGRTLALNPTHDVAHYNTLFALQHRPGITAAELLAAHRRWAAVAAAHPVDAANAPPLAPLPAEDDRLPTIGVLSGDLRSHAVSLLTLRAFEHLAARGARVVCFANAADEDSYTKRWRALSRGFHRVDALADAALLALVRGETIGMLFDLAGLTARHRMPVFAARAAPIQITWAGYTGTTGLSTMDALIADAREVPEGEDAEYAEEVIRLPDCYVCYDTPGVSPPVGPVPSAEAGAGVVRFGCFQRAAKLNGPVLSLWAAISARLPAARFVLRYSSYAEEQTRRVISREAESAGLPPDKLVFEPGRDPYHMLEGYNGIDIALDTLPYSGGVTTLEALWMGVPVITLPGRTFAGRHSASHLHAAGLSELIVPTPEAYVEAAVSLATDADRLRRYRDTLRNRVVDSPLTDGARFAANLESALRALAAKHRRATSGQVE